VIEGGLVDGSKCIARLEPLLAPGQSRDPRLDARLRRPVAERKVGKDGFFQLEDIAPGNYLLTIEQPGYAPARVSPLEVWEKSETFLNQPVTLKRPFQIELSFSPPLDWLGRPWQVQVHRASEFSAGFEPDPVHQGMANREGLVRIPGQSPGSYLVEVADSLGNNFLHERDVRVESAADARRTFEIDLVPVRGKVSIGEEPLAADLRFGGPYGSVRVAMESDKEGAFLGVLPREGSWRVDVQAAEPLLKTHAKVEVKKAPDGEAFVEITLPDTQVFGKVLDENDRPVRGARVSLSSLVATLTTETGKDGEYDLRAVPEGRVQLDADFSSPEGPLTSDQILVDAVESRPAGPVNLVLRRTKSLSGRVQSSRGPIPGAVVRLSPQRPPMPQTQSVRTGPDGSFSARIPSKAESLLAVVSAPGHALKAFEVPAVEHSIALNVPEEGGGIDVTLPFSQEEAQTKGFTVVVLQNGLLIPPSTLFRWAAGHGIQAQDAAGLHLPRLAPGAYEVCVGPAALVEEWELTGWKIGQASCASGFLGAGATLRLEIGREAGEKAPAPGR
jgi:hypothetical protein